MENKEIWLHQKCLSDYCNLPRYFYMLGIFYFTDKSHSVNASVCGTLQSISFQQLSVACN